MYPPDYSSFHLRGLVLIAPSSSSLPLRLSCPVLCFRSFSIPCSFVRSMFHHVFSRFTLTGQPSRTNHDKFGQINNHTQPRPTSVVASTVHSADYLVAGVHYTTTSEGAASCFSRQRCQETRRPSESVQRITGNRICLFSD